MHLCDGCLVDMDAEPPDRQRRDRAGTWDGIGVQVTIHRRLRIGRDGHLDQS